jgi:CO/xanthine dehydrogenase FAD-binding subunit
VKGSFQKLGSRRYLVISITMAGAAIGVDATGRIDHAAVAVGACSAVAQRQGSIERRLIGQRPAEVRITPDHLQNLAPIEDVRGDPVYRLQAACEQIMRAVREAGST